MRTYLLTVPLLLIVFSSCSDRGVNVIASGLFDFPLESTINGKALTFFANQTFSLELDLHADGGYQWDCAISDLNVIQLDSTLHRPKSVNQGIGGLSVESFYFRAANPGQSTQWIRRIRSTRWLEDG